MSPLIIKLLHVVAALWITTGVFGSAVARMALRKATTVPAKAVVARILWRLHAIYTLPGLILAGLFGIHLVAASAAHEFSEVWIAIALLIWIFMFLWTVFVITPALSRLRRAAEATSEADSEGDDRLATFQRLAGQRLWGILSDVNALAILVLTYLMVVQP